MRLRFCEPGLERSRPPRSLPVRCLFLALILLLPACSEGSPAGSGFPDPPEAREDLINPDPLPHSVRFVWFVPTDVPFDEATVDAIRRAAYNTRSWYRAQTGGSTFGFDEEFPVEVVFGEHRRSWYEDRDNPFGWDPVWNANYWVDMEVVERLELEDWAPMHKVAIYMSAEGGGGASLGRLVIPQHDVDGIQDGTLAINRWWGGLAHELGHTFDLPDAQGDDGTIMSGALYAYPATHLTAEQAQAMLASSRNEGFFVERGLEFDTSSCYRMVHATSGRVADLEDEEAPTGAPVVVAEADPESPTQGWSLEPAARGTWRIRNCHTEHVLVVAGRSMSDGAGIRQAAEQGESHETWYVLATGPDSYEVVPSYAVVPNERVKSLTMPPGAQSGEQLVQEDFVTSDRQRWTFRELD